MKPQVGDYALHELLGKGGTHEVYKAVGTRGANDGRTVALKNAQARARQRPNVRRQLLLDMSDIRGNCATRTSSRVLETGIDEDNYFIVMDLIEGFDLSKVIAAAERTRR